MYRGLLCIPSSYQIVNDNDYHYRLYDRLIEDFSQYGKLINLKNICKIILTGRIYILPDTNLK